MTVTDIILNFRSALLGIIPFVERVGIPWKRIDAYDEWDNIAAALYQALVVEPLRFSLHEEEQYKFNLPVYDLLLQDYTNSSIIEVLPPYSDRKIKIFHALGTSRSPFDLVEWRAVGPTGFPESELLETTPLKGARFALRLCKNGLLGSRIEEFAIPPKSNDTVTT